MRRYATLASCVVLAVCIALVPTVYAKKHSANRTDTHQMAAADHNFINKAAMGGMAEVEYGRMAVDKASSADVKSFAQRMIDDHSRANDELKSLSSSKGVNWPADSGPKHKATSDHLAKLSGVDFDKAYMQHMLKDHREDVAEFQKEADHGYDADVKAFASKTLPILKEHLKMAEETAGKVGAR